MERYRSRVGAALLRASICHVFEDFFKSTCSILGPRDNPQPELRKKPRMTENLLSEPFIFGQAVCNAHPEASQHDRNQAKAVNQHVVENRLMRTYAPVLLPKI